MSIFLMDLLSQTSVALGFFDDRSAKLLIKESLSIWAKAWIVDGENIDLFAVKQKIKKSKSISVYKNKKKI